MMGDYRKLIAYQKGFELAMEIFLLTRSFPPEERYGLTSQIRRSSRSVCANLVESYKRKRYKDYFISKLNDSETENAETQLWLEFSLACNYIGTDKYEYLTGKNDEVARLILFMINNPEKFR
jgi:four helix bundle protein